MAFQNPYQPPRTEEVFRVGFPKFGTGVWGVTTDPPAVPAGEQSHPGESFTVWDIDSVTPGTQCYRWPDKYNTPHIFDVGGGVFEIDDPIVGGTYTRIIATDEVHAYSAFRVQCAMNNDLILTGGGTVRDVNTDTTYSGLKAPANATTWGYKSFFLYCLADDGNVYSYDFERVLAGETVGDVEVLIGQMMNEDGITPVTDAQLWQRSRSTDLNHVGAVAVNGAEEGIHFILDLDTADVLWSIGFDRPDTPDLYADGGKNSMSMTSVADPNGIYWVLANKSNFFEVFTFDPTTNTGTKLWGKDYGVTSTSPTGHNDVALVNGIPMMFGLGQRGGTGDTKLHTHDGSDYAAQHGEMLRMIRLDRGADALNWWVTETDDGIGGVIDLTLLNPTGASAALYWSGHHVSVSDDGNWAMYSMYSTGQDPTDSLVLQNHRAYSTEMILFDLRAGYSGADSIKMWRLGRTGGNQSGPTAEDSYWKQPHGNISPGAENVIATSNNRETGDTTRYVLRQAITDITGVNIPVGIAPIPMDDASENSAYVYKFLATGGDSDTQAWTATGLPSGFSLALDGTLTASPVALGTAGAHVISATVTDSTGSANLGFNFTIVTGPPVITTTTLPDVLIGNAYDQQLTWTDGEAPVTWSVAAGSLPQGMVMSAGGRITGNAQSVGVIAFTVQLLDSFIPPRFDTQPLSIEVVTGDLVILTSSLPDATVGEAYSAQLSASGGLGTYAWSVISGNLPTGLSLSTTGEISGVPTVAGLYNPRFEVISAGVPVSKLLPITVVEDFLTAVVPENLPQIQLGGNYSYQFEAEGGTPPYSWQIDDIPPGLSVTTAGFMSGQATEEGVSSLVCTVTDTIAASAAATTVATVLESIFRIVTGPELPDGEMGEPYSYQFGATGGTVPYVWTSPDAPPGLTLTPDGVLSGTPSEPGVGISAVETPIAASYTFTVTSTDDNGNGDTGEFQIDYLIETPGAPADFDMDVGDIIDTAGYRAGLDMSKKGSGYTVRKAAIYLNLIFREWENEGFNPFKVEEFSIPLLAGQRKYDMPRDTVRVFNASLRRDAGTSQQFDRVLPQMAPFEYNALPNKELQGEPFLYYQERNKDISIYLWHVPITDDTWQFVGFRIAAIRDLGVNHPGLDQPGDQIAPDLPARFLPALIADLAHKLYISQPQYDLNRANMMKSEAQNLFWTAQREDRAGVPMVVLPNYLQ